MTSIRIRLVDIGDEDRCLFAWELISGDESLGTFTDYGKAMQAMKELNDKIKS